MEGNVALSSGGADIGRCDIHVHFGGETKRSRVTVILIVWPRGNVGLGC